MRYAYIRSLAGEYSILKMCGWLGVSRAGYYKWLGRGTSESEKRQQHLEKVIATTFERFKHRYGAPRLAVELNESGIPCSVNYVAKLMAQSSLKARNGKGYKFFSNIQARNHVSDNLLRRDFTAERPDEKWVSDITYIPLDKGFAYLAVVMDLYSRRIIGWSLDSTMTNQLIIDAFQMAYDSRQVKPGLILHSDRGVQYRSGEYQHRLLSKGIRPSMSRKGNCWDNAAMESFFSRLKVESVYADQPTTK